MMPSSTMSVAPLIAQCTTRVTADERNQRSGMRQKQVLSRCDRGSRTGAVRIIGVDRKFAQRTVRSKPSDLTGRLSKPKITVSAGGDKTGHDTLRKIKDRRVAIGVDFAHRMSLRSGYIEGATRTRGDAERHSNSRQRIFGQVAIGGE